MMFASRFSYLKITSTAIVLIALVSFIPQNANAYPGGNNPCVADKSWFPHSQTKEPDNAGFKSVNNCVFHQWSWQTFLWLTQDDGTGNPRFMSFVAPESLLGMTTRNPSIGGQPSSTRGPFDEYLQAGSDAVLPDHQGRAVYYAQYVDPKWVRFVNEHQLTNPEKLRKFDPNKSFSIGSMELKVSWKIVEDGQDASQFFTLDTSVYKLKKENGKIVINYEETEKVKLAVVGFHIGGVVNEHPEMIWATFEHKDNAPNVPHKFTPETVISKDDSTFYTGGTKYADCNVNVANTPNQKLDEKTQVLSPITQVCRQYEFGNDPINPKERIKNMEINDNNIKKLNASVLASLASDDVWSNYHEVGAIWFGAIDGLKPNMSLETDDILTGSLKLSNSTIETFTQTQSTENNCFRCHNTMQRFPPTTDLDPLPGLNLNISRALENIYFWSQMQQQQKAAK